MSVDMQDIIDYWQNDLYKYPANLFDNESISLSTQNFLCEVGLPINKDDLFIQFWPIDTKFTKVTINDFEFVILGDDYGTNICLNIKDNTIISIDPKGELLPCFINSNIRLLLIFLYSIHQISNAISALLENGMPHNEVDKKADELGAKVIQQLSILDPKAFDNEENYWPSGFDLSPEKWT
ncbi:MAG TPA: SUKH-4 family immunity protein [Anaerolineae bacterium]|nr:SUKH-4 family immunity protein [Anaerolineae bacterium]